RAAVAGLPLADIDSLALGVGDARRLLTAGALHFPSAIRTRRDPDLVVFLFAHVFSYLGESKHRWSKTGLGEEARRLQEILTNNLLMTRLSITSVRQPCLATIAPGPPAWGFPLRRI